MLQEKRSQKKGKNKRKEIQEKENPSQLSKLHSNLQKLDLNFSALAYTIDKEDEPHQIPIRKITGQVKRKYNRLH